MSGGNKPREFDQVGIGDERLLALLTEIRDNQDLGMRRIAAAEANLLAHISDAFPGGDPEGHRRYHQTQIEMLEEKRKLRIAIQEKTISGLVWALIVVLGLAVWQFIQRQVVHG